MSPDYRLGKVVLNNLGSPTLMPFYASSPLPAFDASNLPMEEDIYANFIHLRATSATQETCSDQHT